MSDYIIHGDSLEDIADAIREKTGTSSPIAVGDMPDLISRISGGSANIWTGTQAEYEAQASQIADDTVVLITDDEQEVSEGGAIYSEEEKVIGLWIDNRPIYQKTFVIEKTNIVGNTAIDINSNITPLNIGNIIGYENKLAYSVSGSEGQYWSDDLARLRQDNTNGYTILLTIGNATLATLKIEWTIKYTKSTDVPLGTMVSKPITFNLANGYADFNNVIFEERYTTTTADYNYEYIATEDCFVVFSNVNGANSESYARVMKDTEVLAEVYSSYSSQVIQSGGSTFLRKGEKLLIHSTYQNAQLNIRVYGINVLGVKPVINYSTDEQVIGTWLGKPLYRKVLPQITKNSGGTSVTHNLGVKYYVNKGGWCYVNGDSNPRPFPFVQQRWNGYCDIQSADADSIILDSSWNNCVIQCYIEYTKESDYT